MAITQLPQTDLEKLEKLDSIMLVKMLALAIDQSKDISDGFSAQLEKLRISDEYIELQERESTIVPLINDLRKAIEKVALMEWHADPAKTKTRPGVKIKESTTTRYIYDDAIVFEWVKNNMPNALSVNKKLFEAHAKSVAKTIPLTFVEIKTSDPVANVEIQTSKLSGFIEAGDDLSEMLKEVSAIVKEPLKEADVSVDDEW